MRETCVSYYVTGVASIPVHFPNGMTVCQWCPYIKYNDGIRRHQCVLTAEFLPYPFDSRGNECPVIFDEEDQNNELDC